MIPRLRSFELIAALRHELQGLAPEAPEVKKVLGVIIPARWLEWLARPVEMPDLVDRSTGEPLLWITDHYRVDDWAALERALASAPDVEGRRAEGWDRISEGDDGLRRRRLTIEPGRRADQVKVTYHTQGSADAGRPWLEALAGSAIVFRSREIADPKGMLAQTPPIAAPKTAVRNELPPEVISEVIERHVRQHYAHWADQPLPALEGRTPREAIQDADGLEQVKFLLHTYEHGEAQQAKAQQRPAVSYAFLWQTLGIRP